MNDVALCVIARITAYALLVRKLLTISATSSAEIISATLSADTHRATSSARVVGVATKEGTSAFTRRSKGGDGGVVRVEARKVCVCVWRPHAKHKQHRVQTNNGPPEALSRSYLVLILISFKYETDEISTLTMSRHRMVLDIPYR